MSARRFSKKNRRKRYKACDDAAQRACFSEENKNRGVVPAKLLIAANLRPVTPSVRNMVALLAWGASHCSLFLPAQRPPFIRHRRREGVSQLTAAARGFCNHAARGERTVQGAKGKKKDHQLVVSFLWRLIP